MKNVRSVFALALLFGTVAILGSAGCEEEDDCLVEGENCSADYVEANYGDGRGCCDGLSCSEGPTSGVLICQ